MAAGLALGALALDAAFPPPLERYHDRSPVVVDREGRPLRMFTSRDGMWRLATVPEDVDARYLAFLKAYEDRRFEFHPGVDPLAVARAAWQWLRSGRPVSGASTLTMQTVRLLEPRPRTLVSKLVETARALQLEWRFDKREILGMYLTLAPFGGNIEGVAAASRLYFGKPPAILTAAEAALLVALPQSPSRLRPDRFPERAGLARAKVLERMARLGAIDADEIDFAAAAPLPPARREAPMAAPHLARLLHERNAGSDMLATTLDGDLQRVVEDLVARQGAQMQAGENVAVLVVENDVRAVRAYVGSAGLLDEARQGHVDMVRAPRSPGSTLKPFIYGLGFDLLNLHPETLVDDRPTRFGDFQPANFDNRYRGRITIREALQLSLNVPAVAVTDALGPARLTGAIAEAGIRMRFDDRTDGPGLPIALGGVGVTLWDLVTLYAGLANRGEVAPLTALRDGPTAATVRLLGERSAWYVTEILKEAPPPVPRLRARTVRDGRRIAVKTGTSYGFRDVWAVGYDARFTVGVWSGRPDGGFGTDRSGRGTAAPILFDVFDLLPPPASRNVAPPPADVIALSTAELPAPMRLLSGTSAAAGRDITGEPLRILFPLDGATIEAAAGGYELKAEGGRRPLRWLVEGRPLESSPLRRSAAWQPTGEGAFRITVVDADGRAARSDVWVRPRSR